MTETITPVRQSLIVRDWHPRTSPNGSHGHWAKHQKDHDIDRDMAWACARQAGWIFVPGKVRLSITLVYPRRTLPDADNVVAKCKGLIDGLKQSAVVKVGRVKMTRHGFFADDSPMYLDLRVDAIVVPGVKETRITLEAAS